MAMSGSVLVGAGDTRSGADPGSRTRTSSQRARVRGVLVNARHVTGHVTSGIVGLRRVATITGNNRGRNSPLW